MSLVSRAKALAVALGVAAAVAATHAAPPFAGVPGPAPVTTPAPPGVLRVCADPNDLPYSDVKQAGFENRIAALAGRALGRRVEYDWMPQRRGFLRNTLNAGACDVVMGLPARSDAARMTRPYYRSTYVFVTRRDRVPRLASFDDPRLKRLRVGVQMIGDDYQNSPAAEALARRGLVDNVRGYMVYGDYSTPMPARRIVDAVARGEIDAAIVWGPLAGYLAQRERPALAIAPVSPSSDGPFLPFVFDIAMGVRPADRDLAAALDGFIARDAAAIDAVLREYGVPLCSREPS